MKSTNRKRSQQRSNRQSLELKTLAASIEPLRHPNYRPRLWWNVSVGLGYEKMSFSASPYEEKWQTQHA
jgi:hypothetical protein